jgi:hypothetical protein
MAVHGVLSRHGGWTASPRSKSERLIVIVSLLNTASVVAVIIIVIIAATIAGSQEQR